MVKTSNFGNTVLNLNFNLSMLHRGRKDSGKKKIIIEITMSSFIAPASITCNISPLLSHKDSILFSFINCKRYIWWTEFKHVLFTISCFKKENRPFSDCYRKTIVKLHKCTINHVHIKQDFSAHCLAQVFFRSSSN